jgi:hypothetical protein
MTATAEVTKITKPGVYQLEAQQYHADPVDGGSLSTSGARKLLAPSCPAKFYYERTHPRKPTEAMTFGSAAHRVVLGEGAKLIVIEAENYLTKAAKTAKAEALEAGNIPLLAKDKLIVDEMAAALRKDKLAMALLDARRGKREQALVWQCTRTGIWCRALVDHLPDPGSGRLKLGDYKTCDSADDESISRAINNYGYHIQDSWYVDGARTLDLGADPVMLFIFQERTPPYLTRVVEVDPIAKDAGAFYAGRARRLFAECTATGVWPSYSDDVTRIGIPPWAQNEYFQESGQ